MLPAARFSRHALDRVQERLTATRVEVAALLNTGLFVPIGGEPGSHRTHRLFHSQRDRTSFVAVQDERDGTVVTVLPIDYHDLCAWQVSVEARRAARSLADYCDPLLDRLLYELTGIDPTLAGQDDGRPAAPAPAVPAAAPIGTPPVVHDGAHAQLSGWRDGSRVVRLGRWPLHAPEPSPHDLLSDRDLLLALEMQMLRAGAAVEWGLAVRIEPAGASAILKGHALAAAFAWARGDEANTVSA